MEHVQDISGYLRKRLEELKTEYPCITERRGRGLMQGLELASSVPAGEISAKALQQGLILITAGNNVLRFLPPLVLEKEHVDEMAEILRNVLGEYQP